MRRRHNYFFLLFGLLVVLVGAPASDEFTDNVHRMLVLDGTLACAFIFGIWTLVRSRKAFIAGCAIAVAFIGLDVAARIYDSTMLSHLTLLCLLLFFLLSGYIAMRDVLFGGTVDVNRIVGAVCIYLLSGAIWGVVYFYLQFYSPGAFAGVGSEAGLSPLGDLTYYSFVTLTTLGFGDISPISPLAKTLSYLEGG